jgi:hypothetical protein
MKRHLILATCLVAATIGLGCGRNVTRDSSDRSGAPTTPSTPMPTSRPPTTIETIVAGQVSALSGTCPAIGFTVAATKVATSATTRFEDGECRHIANGTAVRVSGVKQADGSINATRVAIEESRR